MDTSDIGIALIRGLFASIPFIGALVLGLGLPLAIVATASITQRISPNGRVILLLGAVVLGSALSVAFSGRTLYSAVEISQNPGLARWAQGPSIIGIRFSQVFTLVALLVSLGEIFRWATAKIKLNGAVARLWWAVFLFNGISVGLAGLVGEFRDPELRDLYFIIVVSGLAVIVSGAEISCWRTLRWLLVLPLAGSLVAMVVAPQSVLLNDYQSFIPGLTSRLFGLSEHANGLGLLAVVAIALECSTLVRARPSILMLLLQLTVLVLSQSKTAWVSLFVVLPLVRWHWLATGGQSADPWARQVRLLLLVIGAAVAVAVVVALAASSTGVQRTLEANKVYTLTGRVGLWQMTLSEFYNAPFLGYGPSIWDVQYRVERGLLFAGQAHNQFIQILGQAGALGMISMLAYLGLLGWMSVRARTADHGLTMALFVLLMIRCLTESPLRMSGIMSWDSLLHLLVILGAARYGTVALSTNNGLRWSGAHAAAGVSGAQVVRQP